MLCKIRIQGPIYLLNIAPVSIWQMINYTFDTLFELLVLKQTEKAYLKGFILKGLRNHTFLPGSAI